MRAIQVIKGLKVNDPSLEKIERTPEGVAIGGLPNWEFLVDPDYAETGWIRNRAKPNAKFALQTSSGGGSLTNVINLVQVNGQNLLRSLRVQNGGAGQYRADSADAKVNLNLDEFTIFTVIKQSASADALDFPVAILRPNVSDVAGKLFVGFTPTSGKLRVYDRSISEATSPTMAQYKLAEFDTNVAVDELKAVVLTFSAENGFIAYENGVKVGQFPYSDRLDLEGGFGLFRTSHADWGMTGALNVDLSLHENSVHLRKLTSFLMEKYGI